MIAHVTVRTPKLDESVEFYQWLLSLPVSRKLSAPAGEIVFLGENETKLELLKDEAARFSFWKGIKGRAVVNWVNQCNSLY